MNESINYEAVCRTAPATPDLLNTLQILDCVGRQNTFGKDCELKLKTSWGHRLSKSYFYGGQTNGISTNRQNPLIFNPPLFIAVTFELILQF